MVTHLSERTGKSDAASVRNRITACLRRSQAVSLDDLLESTGLSTDLLLRQLDRLEEGGYVKALRPVAQQGGAPGTHYRLVRDSDHDYLWEQALARPVRLTHNRLRHVLEHEMKACLHDKLIRFAESVQGFRVRCSGSIFNVQQPTRNVQ